MCVLTANRATALAAFHLVLVVAALTIIVSAVASFDGGGASRWAAALAIAELAIVVWWATRRVLAWHAGGRRSSLDGFLGSGVRWGATAGVVLWTALLATWVILGLVSILFFEPPSNRRYNLVGGEYAFLWLSALALVPGGLIAASTGAALGGVIGIIDRVLLTIAHWRLVSPRSR